MKIKALLVSGMAFARKHEGAILTACGIGSTVASVYFAVKDSPKLMAQLDKIKAEEAEGHEFTSIEKAKRVLPYTWRPFLSLSASIAFQLLNNKYASDQINSLTNGITIYKALADKKDQALEDKDAAIEEVVGKEKAEEIKEKYIENVANREYSMFDLQQAEVTGHGSDLIHFVDFDKWFYGSYNWVETGVNACNKKLNNGKSVSINDLFYELGLQKVPYFETVGWREHEDQIVFKNPDGGMTSENRPYVEVELSWGCQPHDITRRRSY